MPDVDALERVDQITSAYQVGQSWPAPAHSLGIFDVLTVPQWHLRKSPPGCLPIPPLSAG